MSSLLDTLSAVRQNVSTTFRAALDPFKAAHGESSGPRDTTPALANRVFGYRHAHTRIKSVLGKELSTGQTAPAERSSSRRPKKRTTGGAFDEKEEHHVEGVPRSHATSASSSAHHSRSSSSLIHGQVQQFSSESSSDEEAEAKRFGAQAAAADKHNYAAMGINPDLPLHHPLNQLHQSRHTGTSPTAFHPMQSPPAPGSASGSAFTFNSSRRNSKSGTPLLHPGLMGVQRQHQLDLAHTQPKPVQAPGMGLGTTTGGTGTLATGPFSSSPFISSTLHSRLALRMQQRAELARLQRQQKQEAEEAVEPPSPPNEADDEAAKAEKAKVQAEFEAAAKAKADAAAAREAEIEAEDIARMLRRNARKSRPKSPRQRVTGTHQLNILHHRHAIHTVAETHQSHLQDHAPELIAPVIKAGWQELDARAHFTAEAAAANADLNSLSTDSSGDLRHPDGTLVTPEELQQHLTGPESLLLDPVARQFLVAYVQSHTSKATDEERSSSDAILQQKERLLAQQREQRELEESRREKTTEDDRRREAERQLTLKEMKLAALPALPTMDLPELPELPPSFYALEATFHQSVSAKKTDIVSAAGVLPGVKESRDEYPLEDADSSFLRTHPRRWRRSSFSRGHTVYPEAANVLGSPLVELDEEDEHEWKPRELLDQFIPETRLGSGLEDILSQVNAAVSAPVNPLGVLPMAPDSDAADAFYIAPPSAASTSHLQASKPLGALSEAERVALERADEAAKRALHYAPYDAEHASNVALESPRILRAPENIARTKASTMGGTATTTATMGATATSTSTVSSLVPPSVSEVDLSLPGDGALVVVREHDGTFDNDVDSQGRLKLLNDDLPDAEKDARLEEYLQARELEEDMAAAEALRAARGLRRDKKTDRSLNVSTADRMALVAMAQQARRKLTGRTAEVSATPDESIASSTLTTPTTPSASKKDKSAVPLTLLQLQEQRKVQEAKMYEELSEKEAVLKWNTVCLEMQQQRRVDELERKRAVRQTEEELAAVQEFDATSTPDEDAQLASAKDAFESKSSIHRSLLRDLATQQAQCVADAETDATEEATWDERLAELEDATKEAHAYAEDLKVQAEDRVAQREAAAIAASQHAESQSTRAAQLLKVASQARVAYDRAMSAMDPPTDPSVLGDFQQRAASTEAAARAANDAANAATQQASQAAALMDDTSDQDAIAQAEEDAEAMLAEYEKLFDEKQDWLDSIDQRKAAEVEAKKQIQTRIDAATVAVSEARSAYADLLAEIEGMREERDATMEALEDQIDELMDPLPELILPDPPAHYVPPLTEEEQREKEEQEARAAALAAKAAAAEKERKAQESLRELPPPLVEVKSSAPVEAPSTPSAPLTPMSIPQRPSHMRAPVVPASPSRPTAMLTPLSPTTSGKKSHRPTTSDPFQDLPDLPSASPPPTLTLSHDELVATPRAGEVAEETATSAPIGGIRSASPSPAGNARSASPLPPTLPPLPTSSTSVDLDPFVRTLQAGCDFTLHSLTPAKKDGVQSASAKFVYFWAEFPGFLSTPTNQRDLEKLVGQASFFCCDQKRSLSGGAAPPAGMSKDEKGRYRIKEQRLPFSIIETLLPGKRTPILQSSFCAHLVDSRCFAFGGPKAMVSLEAQSEGEKDQWTNAIKQIVKQVKAATSAPAPATTAAQKPMPMPMTASTTLPPRNPSPLPGQAPTTAAAASPAARATSPTRRAPSPQDKQEAQEAQKRMLQEKQQQFALQLQHRSASPLTDRSGSPTYNLDRSSPLQGHASPTQNLDRASPVQGQQERASPRQQVDQRASPVMQGRAASPVAAQAKVPQQPSPVRPSPSPSSSSASAPVVGPLRCALPPLVEVAQPAQPANDSRSLLAHGSVFRLFSTRTAGLSGRTQLTSIADHLFFVDFSPRVDGPSAKSATNPIMQAALCYSNADKRQRSPDQSIYLTDILGVTEGKQYSEEVFDQAARALTNPSARVLPASHVFTLTVATSADHPPSTKTLTLQCPSLHVRTLFLTGLYDLFDRQYDHLTQEVQLAYDAGDRQALFPERVLIEPQAEPDDDHLIAQPRTATPPSSSQDDAKYGDAPASPHANAELLSLLLDVMSRGEEFTAHYFDSQKLTKDEVPQRRRIFLWVDFPDTTPAASDEEEDIIHSQDGGVVYWCDSVQARGGAGQGEDCKGVHRFVEAGHFFPLDTICDVQGGKTSRVLQHARNARVPVDCAFTFASVQAGGLALDLEADQPDLQQLWVGALQHVLDSQ